MAGKISQIEADRKRASSISRSVSRAPAALSEPMLPPPERVLRWRDVLTHVWAEGLTAFLTFAVCLACFPGLSTSFRSHTLGLGSWFPLLMVALYNSGDLIGKARHPPVA